MRQDMPPVISTPIFYFLHSDIPLTLTGGRSVLPATSYSRLGTRSPGVHIGHHGEQPGLLHQTAYRLLLGMP